VAHPGIEEDHPGFKWAHFGVGEAHPGPKGLTLESKRLTLGSNGLTLELKRLTLGPEGLTHDPLVGDLRICLRACEFTKFAIYRNSNGSELAD
jgi:hypothetical protein